MDKQLVRQKICTIISREINLEEGLEISDDMLLIENLAFDSVQLISLISEIEEMFGIEFTGDNMLFERFDRIGDLCEMVYEMVQ